MISFEESQRLLAEHIKLGPVVELPLLESLGLTLARPIVARTDSPRFDASAVDGYVVSLSDFSTGVPVTLPVNATIHAGPASRKPLKLGSTHRIFTGALVPKGTDAIVMQEETTLIENHVRFQALPKPGAYIRKRGTEFRRGEQLFDLGTVITPSVAQSLAASGYARAKVRVRPAVSVIITGDELRTPGTTLKPGEIWDSNATALESALRTLGMTAVRSRHVSDNPQNTMKAVRAALQRSDIVIATGGVSVGERDYVKEAFASNGVREVFWRVRMRPGMPIYFGVKHQKGRTKYIFGLPGNPVSVMVTYQLFVRRAILRMSGHAETNLRVKAILTAPLRKSVARTEFVRAYHELSSHTVPRIVPLASRESNMTTGMAKADSLIVFPEQQDFIEAGSEVEIIPMKWTLF